MGSGFVKDIIVSRDHYSSRDGRRHQQGRYTAFRATTTSGFIRVDRAVARALGGIDAAAFFHELAWRSEQDAFTDADGWIDVSSTELEESTTLTRRQQDRIRKVLTDMGVIIVKREGLPARTFFQIDWQEIEDRVAINGEIREKARINQLHQTVQLDTPHGATRHPEPAQLDTPGGASYIREKKTKEGEESSPSVKDKLPMWQRLDPVADRDLIMRNRYQRPELPPLDAASQEVLMRWHQLQSAWDSEWNKDRRLG